jgi:hypothetical protein
MLDVATLSVAGSHLLADTAAAATLAAIPDATGLASCIVLINGIEAVVDTHGASAGVHFHNDAALAAAAFTVDPPVTLANCYTDLNDLLTSLSTHFALAPTNTPV